VLRWDVAVVVAAMAVTKLGALVCYRRIDQGGLGVRSGINRIALPRPAL